MNPKDRAFYGGYDNDEQERAISNYEREIERMRHMAHEQKRAYEDIRRMKEKADQMNSMIRDITIDSSNESIMDSRISAPQKEKLVESVEDTDFLSEVAIVVDADGFVFQRRNGEWFMAGAAFGSTEFSGNFPARVLQA